jgi:hypothetical protein
MYRLRQQSMHCIVKISVVQLILYLRKYVSHMTQDWDSTACEEAQQYYA